MDDWFDMSPGQRTPSAIDMAVLERLFAMGDSSLRRALCLQLKADFRRLNEAVLVTDGLAVGRAAHELKGLAATVGAERLADLARTLDARAESLGVAARAAIVTPVLHEIAAVLACLDAAAGDTPAA